MEHISVISNLYPPEIKGGYEILAEEFVLYARQRYTVSVLTSEGQDATQTSYPVDRTLRPSSPWSRPPVYRAWPKVQMGLQNYWVALDFFQKHRPTRAFFWNLNRIGLGPVAAARKLGIPCYFTINDYYPLQYVEERHPHRWVKKNVMQSWMSWDDMKFTFISEYLRDDLATQGFRPELSNVIYQGTNMSNFPLKPTPWSHHKPLRLLYVGTISEDKGVDTLLKSLVHFDSSYHLTLVGGGRPEYVERLKEFTTQNSLNVEWVGPVPREKVSDYMHHHDALVFPSRWPEPYGLSHLEAIASGLFVVTTTVGGVAEMLKNKDVFVETFEAGNAQELASCLQHVNNYGAEEKEKAQRSTFWVRDYFDLPRYCDALLSFLELSTLGEARSEDAAQAMENIHK